AQSDIKSLSSKYFDVAISNSGSLFWDQVSSSTYKIPKGSASAPIFTSGIWLGGYNSKNQVVVAAQTYRQKGQTEFVAAPVGTGAVNSKYDKVWLLSKKMIESHIEDPTDPPSEILSWPAHGDSDNGEANDLAPFVDVNSNGIYEPVLGDYPLILGTQAAYFILSEADDKKYSNAEHGGFEIHCMAYINDNDTSAAVNRTLFLDYKVFNRSGEDYHDFYISEFNDYDIGYGLDDLIGCNQDLNCSFAYNGDDFDDGVTGYGSNVPAFACVFLNKNLDAHVLIEDDDIIAPSANKIYSLISDKGKFDYNGNPYKGTGLLDSNPSDRKSISSSFIGDFKAGEKICFNMAFVFGQSADVKNSVRALFNKIRSVKSYADLNQGNCFDGYNTLKPNSGVLNLELTTGYNGIKVLSDYYSGEINLYSISGKKVYSNYFTKNEWLSHQLNPGIYIAEILVVKGGNKVSRITKIVID
ncbi:MAG: T9SS type A sorting domain-containing protein, partial [Bacteroidia bacterium]